MGPAASLPKDFATDEEVEDFLANVCTMSWHVEHDRGRSFEENAALLKRQHPEWGSLIDQWGARYLEMSPGPVAGMVDLVERLAARGVALHGLTNMPAPILAPLRAEFPHLGHLDEIVVSGDEGVIKPDRAIFDILLSRLGLPGDRLFFIDDSMANVEAARASGLAAHHFTGAERLAAELIELGLLDP